ncbi:cupin domain-containing protein [Streptomyces sp. B-S-A8]|uniref:Cupin domain-containing protein n=1 Tax=Streptomyces solicavernae TaxID=3043614 RepID=A0ABT6S0P3_9ACTN|nr:cupin domain-containing protein [Streptomyces sp. B-S-A8]MDI3389994.1 cupin domain-containing protein [Streptomyces sp. B-S-A8]
MSVVTRPAAPEAEPQERHVTVVRDIFDPVGLDALRWERWQEPGRAGVDVHRLYVTDDDASGAAMITRMAPGAHGDLHEHLGYELILVLEGELCNDNGDRYRAGDLVVEEPGSVHRVSTGTGCTVLGVRHAPTRPVV